ncbi:MAG: hypothetical protein N4J56_006980 [Chroococcidiopsis sp. SAG 2025]|nr:hypothetical protein [Chroococcidiopsis sp. SAG 2025]
MIGILGVAIQSVQRITYNIKSRSSKVAHNRFIVEQNFNMYFFGGF